MAYDTLAEIDTLMFKINKYIPLNLQPQNEEEEKQKFFRSTTYSPFFRYSPPIPQLDYLLSVLNKLNINTHQVWGFLLDEKRKEFIDKIHLIKATGTHAFSRCSEKLFGKPSDHLLTIAERYKHSMSNPEDPVVTAEQLKLQLEHALNKFGFKWDIQMRSMIASAAVYQKDRILYIKKGVCFPRNFIKRLIVHEIGTHILRAENADRQPYKIFLVGLGGYLKTEEGLAVLNEEINHCMKGEDLKRYAGRVIAVNKALKCSFRETYNLLLPHYGKNDSWILTMRAKRGIGDTYWPGAFTKDYLYLQGYLEMKNYLKKGGDLSQLYYGRIALHHIKLIKGMKGIINPLFLPGSKYLVSITNEIGNMVSVVR